MKSIIVFACALVAVALAAPSEPEPVQVVYSENIHKPDGSYKFNVQTSDGVAREETGELKQVLNEKNEPVHGIIVRGYYTIPNIEGKHDTINFTADENGYHASGDTIHKGPEQSSL